MNLLDHIHLQVQQQAAHELADRLRGGSDHDPRDDHNSEICLDETLLTTLIQQITRRQAAAFTLNGRLTLRECQE